MNTAEYIEAIKPLAKRPTVYAVAQLLDIPEETARAYAKGRRHLDALAANKIAELLDVPPMLVIADVEAAREGDEKRKVYWQDLARKLAGSTAAIAMVIVTCAGSYFIQPQNAWANAGNTAQKTQLTLYYVKSLALALLSRLRQFWSTASALAVRTSVAVQQSYS